jgi:hypothetical protein
MATGILSALVAFLGIAATLLNAYMAAAPKRKKEAADEAVDSLRVEISKGNVLTVNDALDHLMRNSAAGDTPTVRNSATQPGSTGTEQRVVNLGVDVDNFVGKG